MASERTAIAADGPGAEGRCRGTGCRAVSSDALLEILNDAVFVHDPETGAVLDVNRKATEMWGASREEMCALTVADISENVPPYTQREALAHLRAARDGAPQLFEWHARRRSGELFWVEVNITLVDIAECERLVAVVRDVTDRKRAEEALQAREAELREAQRVAHVGSWAWTVGTELLEASDEVIRIFGLEPGQPIPLNGSDALRRHYTPEGWQRRTEAFAKALADGQPWEREEQILRPDGSVRWVHMRGEVERARSGAITKLRGIAQDITERKLAEQALREADRRKDEFLATLSHELRNPLGPIRNSVYILEHGHASSEQAARARSTIKRQAEHLTQLVDDLLDVTRIGRGKIQLRRSRVDLREIVARVADDFRFVMEERGIALRTALAKAPVWVHADPTRLTQIAGNLLQNAAKFTCRGDEVAVSVRAVGDAAELRVRDTGAGIEPAVLPHIFGAFVQDRRAPHRTDGGLGLGLALVKGLAELHGGTARAESAGTGKGAELTVQIPLLRAASVPEEEQEHDRPELRTARRHVLIVDDNGDAADSLAELVNMLGHRVEIAYDGPSAIEKVRANPPSVVLCDLALPGMSGYGVAQAIRATGCHGIQLFAISGYTHPEDVDRAVAAGFDAHIAKPCDPEEIRRILG